jgi:hypothetical protein
MSDYRRPTDGELFRHYRPGAGRTQTDVGRKRNSGKKWRPASLGGPQLTLFAFARTNLKDWELIALVRDVARWANQPSGLVERHPDRDSIENAFRKLLYKVSDGEARFHLRKLEERRSKARVTRAASPTTDAGADRAEPPFATFLVRKVPRPDACAILRLVAHDIGAEYPQGVDDEFEPAVVQFVRAHLSEARAEQFLAELVRRESLGLPWIRPDRAAPASEPTR